MRKAVLIGLPFLALGMLLFIKIVHERFIISVIYCSTNCENLNSFFPISHFFKKGTYHE